jgi:DNA-binding NtrC family response regulator
VALATGERLGASDLDIPDHEPSASPSIIMAETMVVDLGGFQATKAKMIDEFERTYLSKLLSSHQGNISKAARAAKKERRAFQRLLHKHGLDRHMFSAA